jgi:hypothetical protein
VDKSIVMPRVEEFIIFQEKYADLLAGGWDVVGRWVFTRLRNCWKAGLHGGWD